MQNLAQGTTRVVANFRGNNSAPAWSPDGRFLAVALSKDGLALRDAFVLDQCRDAAVPVVIAMAGGYARDTEDTVDIHLRTIRTAVEVNG